LPNGTPAGAGGTSAGNIQGTLHLPGFGGGRRKRRRGDPLKAVEQQLRKDGPQTLYVSRPVLNADRIIAWAKDQGFPTTLPEDELHVTIAFSRKPLLWQPTDALADTLVIPSGTARSVVLFDGGALVLSFVSPELAQRWSQFINQGATWDWPQYQPHITISYAGEVVDLPNVVPYEGEIVLGPEVFQEVNEDWKDSVVEKNKPSWTEEIMQKVGARHSKSDNEMIQDMHDKAVKLGAQCSGQPDEVEKSAENARIVKVDENLGVVFGYAIVCKHNGEPYYDLNIDPGGNRVPEHIPEHTMLKASMDFMQNSRMGNEMHCGPDCGSYVYAFPMTTDIAKSLGINTNTTGLLVGFKPPPEVFEKFKNGTYKGFSIEGRRLSVQEEDYE